MTDQAATEATELDKTRRYLSPVQATVISDDPDGVHLAVYSWLPMFKEWVLDTEGYLHQEGEHG